MPRRDLPRTGLVCGGGRPSEIGSRRMRGVGFEGVVSSACLEALLRLGEGVIHHVIPAPAAVGRQVGLDAVAHGRGHHLGW